MWIGLAADRLNWAHITKVVSKPLFTSSSPRVFVKTIVKEVDQAAAQAPTVQVPIAQAPTAPTNVPAAPLNPTAQTFVPQVEYNDSGRYQPGYVSDH
jgi:hypothetical protein